MTYTAKQIEALRRYQCESGSRELNLEKAMKEYEAAKLVQKTLKPFSKEKQLVLLECVKLLTGAR